LFHSTTFPPGSTTSQYHPPSYPLALPTACPPYLYELAQANWCAGLEYISHEPSLPSIMSMPCTRPASPGHIHSHKTSFAAR
jgi:hypothetical protein